MPGRRSNLEQEDPKLNELRRKLFELEKAQRNFADYSSSSPMRERALAMIANDIKEVNEQIKARKAELAG